MCGKFRAPCGGNMACYDVCQCGTLAAEKEQERIEEILKREYGH